MNNQYVCNNCGRNDLFSCVTIGFPKLESGMFGEMNNGKIFVVVNDLIVYQDGDFDNVSTFNNDELQCNGADISIIMLKKGVKLFNLFKGTNGMIIFDRSKLPKRMTVGEIEEALGYKIEIVGDTE